MVVTNNMTKFMRGKSASQYQYLQNGGFGSEKEEFMQELVKDRYHSTKEVIDDLQKVKRGERLDIKDYRKKVFYK